MLARIVKAPCSLLVDHGLGPELKLLRIALELEPRGHRPKVVELARALGLSEPTVRKGLANVGSGWLGEEPGWVSIPSELLLDKQLDPFTRLMYGILQMTPRFGGTSGHFRYAELASLAGVCVNTAKRAVRELHVLGWIHLHQQKKSDPIGFRLRNPYHERRMAEAIEAHERLNEAPFRGEALMREFLTLLVDSDEYEDDASPGFLVNPTTGEELQLDRYYPPRVAFEFNGPQHYGVTVRYPSHMEFLKQRSRDLIKAGICSIRGIHLVIVHAEDLSLERMRLKIGDLLPLRSTVGHEPLAEYLESEGRSLGPWGQGG